MSEACCDHAKRERERGGRTLCAECKAKIRKWEREHPDRPWER